MDSRRMCPHCRAFITNKDKICPYCNEQVGPRAIDRRSPADFLGGLIPHARFNTIVILLANFGLYLVSTLYSMRAGGGGGFSGIDGATLFAFGAKFGAAIAAGQWWRLVTAGFLHGGLLHILMNSWVLFDLAPQVEEMFGASRMWVIYFVSSVGGFYLSNLWNPRSLSVGASAALCGLIGAMIALGVTHHSAAMGAAIRSTYMRWAIYILIFSFLPGVDMAAHIGGGITGFAVAYLAGTPRYEGSPVERLWQAGALICLGLTGLSFALWWVWFSHTA
ncbi:MAG: rhomboid family intramembrane serine protease [Bryobacteraceae bacterium]|jgi:rhomboid protease GluP